MSKEVETTLGEYLLERLSQLGTRSVFGVPGDFSLAFLDQVEDHPSLNWVGSVNELNAGYAADGYARAAQVQRGQHHEAGKVGVLVNTFGVGELSAANAVAGSFAEMVPVVHIVGCPSTKDQGAHSILHHTLGDGRFDAFQEMARKITAAALNLGEFRDDLENATRRIDQVLETCVSQSRPVYITLPSDMSHLHVQTSRLSLPLKTHALQNDPDAEKQAMAAIMTRVAKAKRPIILVDACATRHRCIDETLELVRDSGFMVFASPMGKTTVPEDHPQYGGIYVGSNTRPEIKEVVEGSDLIFSIGAIKSDFNTASFSYRTRREATVEFHSDKLAIGHATYSRVGMKEFMPKVAEALRKDRDARLLNTRKMLPPFRNILPTRDQEGTNAGPQGDLISQAWLWPKLGSFFRSGDQIIVETGTSTFGAISMALPDDTRLHNQVLWGSIGWSVPAALGVALAAQEDKTRGRVFCCVGDGSLQLTVQELSCAIRLNVKMCFIVLRNDGFEIERQIHGKDRSYNDIAPWDLASLLNGFSGYSIAQSVGGGEEDAAKSHSHDRTPSPTRYLCAKNKGELEKILSEVRFNEMRDLTVLEIFMRRGDAPQELKGQARASSRTNG